MGKLVWFLYFISLSILDPFYSNIKTIFSIHNLLFQGTYSPEILPELFGYDLEPYYNGSLKIDRGVSFIKGGINYSIKLQQLVEVMQRK